MLTDEEFISVINLTPLISIDFIVKNDREEILLGKRVNSPARGYYFVPGGRVFKNESIDNAFYRLSFSELGVRLPREKWTLHGVYEHFYSDNKYNDSFSTHYVVLAFEIVLNHLQLPPLLQHSDYKWFNKTLLINDDAVHTYTKNYFTSEAL
ncbi:TPA: GDP-mannose mannosyl hydrolase [Raoultella planticola]